MRETVFDVKPSLHVAHDGTFLPTTDQRCTAPYMAKGKGPKPKTGGSDALAKSLGVAKYTRLKPGELQRLSFSVGAL